MYIRPLTAYLKHDNVLPSTTLMGRAIKFYHNACILCSKVDKTTYLESLQLSLNNTKLPLKIRKARTLKIEIPNSVRKNNYNILSKLSPWQLKFSNVSWYIKHHYHNQRYSNCVKRTYQHFSKKPFNNYKINTGSYPIRQISRSHHQIKEPHHLEEVLYQLVKPERRILWHRITSLS